jgi:hypothetical protein
MVSRGRPLQASARIMAERPEGGKGGRYRGFESPLPADLETTLEALRRH